jgi:trk system potassium uptake protein TrkH
MDPFSAICITLGTAGTGGFGIVNSSCANYTFVQQVIVTIFMMLFGVNFNLYFYLSKGKYRDAFSIEEVRWYFGIYAAAVIFIVLNIANNGQTLTVNIKDAAFSVAAVMTTTGYATADFDKWPMFSRCILVTVMFIGACAGSTGGGMKVSRIMIYLKSLKKELSCMIHQKSVKIIKMDGKAVDHKVLRNANVFLVSYVIIFFASFLLITLDNFDFETSFTSVVATLNNIGPGLGMVGPTGNFSAFSTRSKIVLIFDMLTGRLEIFPMLLLIYPKTWSRK